MSSFEFIGQWSNLKPHLPANQMALATGYLNNKYAQDSTAELQRGRLGSSMPILGSLVGKELEPILQSSILILSRVLSLHGHCQGKGKGS